MDGLRIWGKKNPYPPKTGEGHPGGYGEAHGRDRREIPPLRGPTPSRSEGEEKRRPAPVGMTVLGGGLE